MIAGNLAPGVALFRVLRRTRCRAGRADPAV